jgi:hypothetical protein
MKKLILSLFGFCLYLSVYSQCSIVVVEQIDPLCPGECTGSATIQPMGVPPFDIIWWDTYETTETVTDLCPNWSYSVQITDDTGCVASINVYINEPSYPDISAIVEDESCSGSCDGSIILQINGSNPPYDIVWNYGEYSGDTITGLCGNLVGTKEASYYAEISDALGCMFFDSYYIMEGPFIEVYINNIIPSDCAPTGSIDLEIIANGGGGQAKSLTYLWSSGATTEDLINIEAGFYSITVTDTNSCSRVDTFLVPLAAGNFPELTVASYQNTNCMAANNDNGYIVLDAVGTAPFHFTWSTGLSGEGMDSIGGLQPGIYRVTVTDSGIGTNSCANYLEYEIYDRNLKIDVNGSDTDCPSYTNGSAYANVYNGESPFTFLWDGGSTNDYINNLDAGVYQVTVSDAFGCTAVGTVGIGYYWGIQDSSVVMQKVCYGQNNGALKVTTNSAYPPYNYQWSNGMSFSGQSDNFSVISGLAPGIYSVTITDSSPFSYTCNNGFAWFELKEATSAVQLDMVDIAGSCYGADTSAVTLTVSGGKPPYTYSLDSVLWQQNGHFSMLMPGAYTAHITDAIGCYLNGGSVNVVEYDEIIVNVNASPVDCGTTSTGSAEAIVTQGTAPLGYAWNSGGATPLIENLIPGMYIVSVTDAYGCLQVAQAEITQLNGWQISGLVQSSSGPLGQDEAMVKMFVEVPNVYQIAEQYSTSTLSGGNFVIEGQQAGFYRFAIRPDQQMNPLYLNTWYNGVVAWENAEVVNIMCGDTLSGFLFNVLELPTLAGNGSFSGYIYYWDNTKAWRAVGEPVEGAEVFVEQQPNDNPVANTNTDVNGFWEVNNLEENYSYDIHVDVPGLPLLSTYSNIPVTASSSDYENLNFYVDTTGQYNGIFIDTLVGIGGSQAELRMTVYPNPVKDVINISISSGNDAVIGWELFSANGRLVDARKDKLMQAGESQIHIPVIEKGTYFLIITSDNNKFIKKLIKE